MNRRGCMHDAIDAGGGTHDRIGVADVAVMDLNLGQIGQGA
jgi:hypothetical protein